MTGDNHDLRVSARTARLTAGPTDDDGPPYHFGGIAVAAGDVLHMDDGTQVLMTAGELEKAAETQAGEPLTADHPEDDRGRPKYPPDVDETEGKVPKAGWVEDEEAVAYEATTHNEDLAAGVQAGSFDVSVHPFFDVEPYDGPEADVKAVDINFGDLSVVSKGDSPSATVEFGRNQALAQWTTETDIGAELTTDDDPGDGDGPRALIASTVRGTLEAIGIQPAEIEADVQTGNEPAESGADGGSSSQMADRNDIISTLSDERDFDEEWLEDADDDHLEQLHESLVDSDDGTTSTDAPGDGAGTDDGGDGQTLSDMTVDDLAEGLEERGFVTEENADEVVAQANRQTEKSEKVEEIVAKSDDFDEDDRQELLASADKIVDREYKRVRSELAAQLPGAVGQPAQLTAGSDGDDDLDEYGTGVQGD